MIYSLSIDFLYIPFVYFYEKCVVHDINWMKKREREIERTKKDLITSIDMKEK